MPNFETIYVPTTEFAIECRIDRSHNESYGAADDRFKRELGEVVVSWLREQFEFEAVEVLHVELEGITRHPLAQFHIVFKDTNAEAQAMRSAAFELAGYLHHPRAVRRATGANPHKAALQRATYVPHGRTVDLNGHGIEHRLLRNGLNLTVEQIDFMKKLTDALFLKYDTSHDSPYFRQAVEGLFGALVCIHGKAGEKEFESHFGNKRLTILKETSKTSYVITRDEGVIVLIKMFGWADPDRSGVPTFRGSQQ